MGMKTIKSTSRLSPTRDESFEGPPALVMAAKAVAISYRGEAPTGGCIFTSRATAGDE
jgi:hypothetical protein